MTQPAPLSEQEQADLVAYLDGELKGQAAHAVEARLVRDAAVRAEADSLKKAWDLLDFLPRPEPSPNFTHRTLSRVNPVQKTAAAAAIALPPASSGALWRLALAAGWLACLALAAVGGFLLYEVIVPSPQPHPNPEARSGPTGHDSGKPEPAPGQPVRLNDLPPNVQAYVMDKLWPLLDNDERDQLKKAEGQWPLYEHTLRNLAGRHEVLPPVQGKPEYTRYDELPREWQQAFPFETLRRHKVWQTLKAKEKKWPDFALWLTEELVRKQRLGPKGPLPPLGACKPRDFSEEVQKFLDQDLRPRLSAEEKKRLDDDEGKWPEYPRTLAALARRHHLAVPGLMLPEF
jgi:hypothetical protein